MQSKLKVAMAVACALGAPAAFAQISTVNPPAAADVLPIAGATSTEPLIVSSLLDSTVGMCQDFTTTTGTNSEANVFTTEASFGNANGPSTLYANFAVVCAASQASGLNATNASPGKTLALVKNTGSSATSFALAVNLGYNDSGAGDAHWVNITPAGCTGGPVEAGGPASAEPDSGINRIHYRVWTGCGNQGSVVPKVGITDVEGSFFVTAGATIPAAPSGSTNTQHLTNAILANTTQYSFGNINAGLGWVDVPFAPIVSVPFYKALQNAQLTGAQVAACRGNNALTGDANFPVLGLQVEACIPSLSTQQIVGLLTQSQNGVAPFLSTTAFPNLAQPADGGIYICERSSTSGTEASFNAYYLGFGCVQGAPKIVAGTNPGGTADFTNTAANRCGTAGIGNCGAVGNGGDYYWANQTTSGVRLCVANRTADGDANAATDPGDQWAVGIISFDQVPDDTFNGQFRYVKVDGVTPNLENIVRGSWRFYETDFLQVPTAASGNTLTADQTTLYQSMSNVVQSVGATSKSEVTTLPYGLQGYLLQPGGPSALVPTQGNVTTAAVLANPVNSSVKGANTGAATSNCLAPNQLYNEDALATQ